MADSLLLHYNPGAPDHATWSLVNPQGELTSRIASGPLEEARDIATGRRTVVLLDARSVHLNHVNLPTSNRQKMLRAVPYALEEQIAGEIEDFHFVIGNRGDTGTAVAGIHRSTLDAILARFQQASIRPDAMIADALCLPQAEAQWTVLLHDDHALVSFGNDVNTVIDAGILPLLLQAQLKRTDTAPERIVMLTPDGETPPKVFDDADDAPEIVQLTYNTHPLVVFCGHYADALALNLLQGAYKPRRKHADAMLRWRLPAALAASWLLLYLGNAAFELNKLEQANNELAAQIEKIYKDSFPQSKRVVNARVQMEQKLKELKSGGGGSESDFLALLTESVSALGSQQDITIESINYRSQRMNIGVTGSKLQSVETLNTMLNKNPKLKSELSSATAENNEVKGSIRLQRNAS
jgi:general secretion pathway protein L